MAREAALVVPRGGKVGYEPMIEGVLKRARQSGQVANVIAKVVYAGDEFDYVIDEHGEHLTHRPAFIDGADILKVYAFAWLTSGEIVVEVMPKAEVDKVRMASRAGNSASAPWNAWYDRMALKTVTKRLARRLPNASELFSLLEVGPRGMAEGEKIVSGGVQARTTPRLRDMLMEGTRFNQREGSSFCGGYQLTPPRHGG